MQRLEEAQQCAHHDADAPDLAQSCPKAASNFDAVLVHGILDQSHGVHPLWYLHRE